MVSGHSIRPGRRGKISTPLTPKFSRSLYGVRVPVSRRKPWTWAQKGWTPDETQSPSPRTSGLTGDGSPVAGRSGGVPQSKGRTDQSGGTLSTGRTSSNQWACVADYDDSGSFVFRCQSPPSTATWAPVATPDSGRTPGSGRDCCPRSWGSSLFPPNVLEDTTGRGV